VEEGKFMADNLLDELFRKRDEWRRSMANTIYLVKGSKLPWEWNRQGKMKWYLHPALTDRAIRSLMVYVQEIPPLSNTGKQKHQGGLVHYILEGRGFTLISGKKHEWEEGDCVILPTLPEGVEYQHFNIDPDKSVQFIAAQANLFDALGVDMGSGFEQLEDAPGHRSK
jgi:gentisate 1,2-dioxygenase